MALYKSVYYSYLLTYLLRNEQMAALLNTVPPRAGRTKSLTLDSDTIGR